MLIQIQIWKHWQGPFVCLMSTLNFHTWYFNLADNAYKYILLLCKGFECGTSLVNLLPSFLIRSVCLQLLSVPLKNGPDSEWDGYLWQSPPMHLYVSSHHSQPRHIVFSRMQWIFFFNLYVVLGTFHPWSEQVCPCLSLHLREYTGRVKSKSHMWRILKIIFYLSIFSRSGLIKWLMLFTGWM